MSVVRSEISAVSALQRRKPLADIGNVAMGDTFLVTVEGQVTERRYLEEIRRLLGRDSVHVRVLSPGHRDPVGLVQEAVSQSTASRKRRARDRAGIREPERYDHVWIVFDTEGPDRTAALKEAIQLACSHRIRVAYSTPSFEFWLLLHFNFTTQFLLNSKAAEKAVTAAWRQTYAKDAPTFLKLWESLRPVIRTAVLNSKLVRDHHRSSAAPFPPNPGTEMDLLVRALNASARPELRIQNLS